MYIKTIKYVAAIAQEGSFSKAAEKLYISQPALSKCIKKLEDELNTPLFERKGNILELTAAGEVFVQDASSILQLYEKMLRRIANLANMYEDTVHFGISPFYSKYYLSRILPSLYANHPRHKSGGMRRTFQYSRTDDHKRPVGFLHCSHEPRQPTAGVSGNSSGGNFPRGA